MRTSLLIRSECRLFKAGSITGKCIASSTHHCQNLVSLGSEPRTPSAGVGKLTTGSDLMWKVRSYAVGGTVCQRTDGDRLLRM